MNNLYKKDGLAFSLVWIGIYCLSQSIANFLNKFVNIPYFFNCVFVIIETVIILAFIKRNNLYKEYGLCTSKLKASKMLYYLPLAIIATFNLRYKLDINIDGKGFYLVCMLFVGFIEEILMRGFLFKSIAKENVKGAIIISSITFGLGHIINLINGSGANLIDNLLQIIFAMAIGFLFVLIFYVSGSIWPCVIVHSFINVTSVLVARDSVLLDFRLKNQAILLLLIFGYVFFIYMVNLRKKDVKGDLC